MEPTITEQMRDLAEQCKARAIGTNDSLFWSLSHLLDALAEERETEGKQ